MRFHKHFRLKSFLLRLDLIPEEVKSRQIKTLEEREDWFSLGRLYRELAEHQLAAQTTCMGVVEAIDKGNVFSAAFHLKEMISEGILDSLFIEAMAEAEEQNDLWWQYRCLEELEQEEPHVNLAQCIV